MIFKVFLHHGMSMVKDTIKSTLSFLGIRFTGTTCPLGLQRHHWQQCLLLQHCTVQPCMSLVPRHSVDCSP